MEDQGVQPAQDLSATPAPPVPEGRTRGKGRWRWFLVGVVVLLLSAFACSAIAYWSFVGSDTPSLAAGDAVALLHLDGVIAGTGSVYNGIITPEYFVDQLEQAENDPRVRAILIRVDSPGGTVAASQEIAMEMTRLTKPVVVSVGDVCASGAYMVAAQSDAIVATPTSSVGSIGVIAQIPNVEGLLDNLGIEFQVLTAGEYKDAGSPYRSLTATETALFEEYIDVAYREFIRIVAEGREMPEAEVEEMANGWIWPGTVALEMGLVDSLGTYNDALDRAAELGGIEGEPFVVSYTETDFSAALRSLIGFGARLERLGSFSPDADAVRRTLPH